jgi:hypothetical protein
MRGWMLHLLLLMAVSATSCKRELCDDTCYWPQDGECDDGGPGSVNDYCQFGTDCSDCGTRTE